jgi:DNA-binding beta-propeller fold protein YncE
MRRLLPLLAAVWLTAGAAAGPGLPAPTISGPRQTTSQEPSFVFRSAGATRFLCAFDSIHLRECASPYSEWLRVGSHVLRVQAVGKARSPVTRVGVRIVSTTGLYTTARIQVGPGAGVPAVDRGAVWVPTTRDGSVSRVSTATNRVVKTIKLGTPPRFQGYLDSAVAAGGSIWVARDVGSEIDRIDPRTNRITARIKVGGRPGGLAVGGGYVWGFHFEGNTVARIDAATGAKMLFTVPRAFATGIVYAAGAVWLLSVQPASLFKLDPADGKVLARIEVTPRRPATHGIVDTWWIAGDDDAVWLVNANYDLVTRVDATTAKVAATVPVPVEIPFGIAVGRGGRLGGRRGQGRPHRSADESRHRRRDPVEELGSSLHPGGARPLWPVGNGLRRGRAVPHPRAVAAA